MQQPRWEYKLIDSDAVAKSGTVFRSARSPNIESYLASLGRQGWEVTALSFFDMRGSFRGVVKRQLAEQPAAGEGAGAEQKPTAASPTASTVSLNNGTELAMEVNIDATEVTCTKLDGADDQSNVYPADSPEAIAIAAETSAFLDRIEAIISGNRDSGLFS